MSLPPHMCADDPTAADPARRRLLRKSTFLHFPRLQASSSPKISLTSLPSPDHPTDSILIYDAHLPLPSPDNDVDLFRWAVLYENQRGITLFSTPFYSPLSLLPSDPQPFTLPDSRRASPNISLNNYPLPDGTWRWVSTAWMIDMRSGFGEVQHDGFEYNWSFRRDKWHATVGKLGTGAWVRRRRWIRLMMRPALHTHSATPSRSPSLVPISITSPVEFTHVWDGSEHDWQIIQRLIKHLGRDGRKLELWRMWLGPLARAHTSDIKGKGKQSDSSSLSSQRSLGKRLSDVIPEGNHPHLVHLTNILSNHGEAILRSFVFPESRARFIELVKQAGLAQELQNSLGRAFSATDVDFWSYADDLNKLGHSD